MYWKEVKELINSRQSFTPSADLSSNVQPIQTTFNNQNNVALNTGYLVFENSAPIECDLFEYDLFDANSWNESSYQNGNENNTLEDNAVNVQAPMPHQVLYMPSNKRDVDIQVNQCICA